jgi:hypothetical protein
MAIVLVVIAIIAVFGAGFWVGCLYKGSKLSKDLTNVATDVK